MRSAIVILNLLAGLATLWLVLLIGGCSDGMSRIDKQVNALLLEGSGTLGTDAFPPSQRGTYDGSANRIGVHSPEANERPTSVNPAASDLSFNPMDDAGNVLSRLDAYVQTSGDPLKLDLTMALRQAFKNSREYIFAEEDYILAALRLLIEEHRWGPQFFDDVTANVVSQGDDGFFTTSLDLINEFRVTQRLPYGGTVSARALARATEDLHSRVSDGDTQSAELIIAAEIPLLRGSGLAARETLIQRNRELIYAARDFENFRRDFLTQIVRDFLDLAVLQRSVSNAERQVEQLRQVEQRERALYESGRSALFDAALAGQSTVSALDNLYQRRESYQLEVDRFKVRLGLPVEQPVEIIESSLELPVPDSSLDQAVRSALAYRLDLQTQRDQVDDARRGVAIARNGLLPDLNLTGSVNLPSNDADGWYRLGPKESVIRAGVTFGLPIDREIERLQLRQSQITLERAELNLDDLRDNIIVDARGAVRAIDRARYSLQIQERNIQIGEERLASIDAAPDRATARDASDAANDLLEAKDNRDRALRDLQQAILEYLRLTGQLRVTLDGRFQPLTGMVLQATPLPQEEFFIIPRVFFLKLPPAVLRPVPGENQPDVQPGAGDGRNEDGGGG